MPTPELVVGLLAKAIGAVSGAIMALAILPPRTVREFWKRLGVSTLGGIIGAPVVISYAEWEPTTEIAMASAAIAAFVSWWLGGAVIRAARKWTPPPPS